MNRKQIRNMALCAMFSAVLCVCAWLGFPIGDVYITMQTFGVFLCLGLMGGKYGSISILIYLLLGVVGLPVFSGFRGGLGVLLGTSGGYIWGLLVSGLVYWLITAIWKKGQLVAMIAGLLICYTLGSFWYWLLYLQGNTLWAVLLKCVIPYLIPDGFKLAFAFCLAKTLRKYRKI